MAPSITRRTALHTLASTTTLMASASLLSTPLAAAEKALPADLKGRIRHSVCQWCYKDIPREELCRAADFPAQYTKTGMSWDEADRCWAGAQ